MTTAASAVWRVRPGGNSANGAGYDSGSYPGGTDYSQQNAAQLTLSDLACSNTTTLTSATGGFTAAMVGNAIRITGGGSTTGYYWITARTNTNTVTLDRSPGTVSAGSGRVGGAAGLPSTLGTGVVAGNIVYILGVAGNAASYPISSLDYSETGSFTPTAGNSTSGYIKWAADPAGPMPTLASNGNYFNSVSYQWFSGLYLTCTSNTSGTNGIIIVTGPGVMTGCVVNTANRASMVGVYSFGGNWKIVGSEFYGGTASPTLDATSYLVRLTSTGNLLLNNTLHAGRSAAIFDDSSSASNIHFNRIFGCAGQGISQGSAVTSSYVGNTIHANAGHGIQAASGYSLLIVNNCITSHTGSGKAGISVTGTTAANDLLKVMCDYNNVYNNTANYSGISAGAHDISVDPGYTDEANGDFTPTNTADRAGY